MPLVTDIVEALDDALSRLRGMNGQLDPSWSVPMDAKDIRDIKEDLWWIEERLRQAYDWVDMMIDKGDDDEPH